MKRKQYLLLVVLTVVAGLIGGAVSNYVLMAGEAVAQETKQHEKVITAEEFRLVDEEGDTLAILGEGGEGVAETSGIGLWIYQKGAPFPAVSLSLDKDGKPMMVLLDMVNLKYSQLLPDAIKLDGSDVSIFLSTPGIFISKKGSIRAWLSLSPDGNPYLKLYDKDDNLRTALGSTTINITATGETRK